MYVKKNFFKFNQYPNKTEYAVSVQHNHHSCDMYIQLSHFVQVLLSFFHVDAVSGNRFMYLFRRTTMILTIEPVCYIQIWSSWFVETQILAHLAHGSPKRLWRCQCTKSILLSQKIYISLFIVSQWKQTSSKVKRCAILVDVYINGTMWVVPRKLSWKTWKRNNGRAHPDLIVFLIHGI